MTEEAACWRTVLGLSPCIRRGPGPPCCMVLVTGVRTGFGAGGLRRGAAATASVFATLAAFFAFLMVRGAFSALAFAGFGERAVFAALLELSAWKNLSANSCATFRSAALQSVLPIALRAPVRPEYFPSLA